MFSDPQKNIEQFHVDPGMKVADLGSGSGFYSLALAEAVGGSGKVFAVDIQKDLLSKLKNEANSQGYTQLEIVWGDIDEPNGSTLSDQLVDRVIIANTLFQLEKKDETIREAKRILKPKGKLLIVDWTDSFGGLGPHTSDVVSADQAIELAEENGFKLDREIMAGEHHYGLIFKLK